MARRAGLADLAAAAGVSLATVDRLLNGREAVSPATAERVAEAAARLGHPAAARLAAGGKAQTALPVVRFGVVLHKQGQDFYRAFAAELQRALREVAGVDGRLVLEFSASQSPSDMAAQMRQVAARCDVLAATAVNHPEVTAAVEEIRARELPVVALLSDFAQGVVSGYFGLDNLKVGRTAGWITALAAPGPGKVGVFVGGHRWHGHDLREAGFRAVLRESAPQLEVLEPQVNLETRQLTYEAVLALAARHPDLRGIYVAGGGMEGAIAALRELKAAGRVACVVSALTPESRAGLAEGLVTMVIDTPLDRLCRCLFAAMARAALTPGEGGSVGTVFLAPEIHVRESL